MLAIDTRRKANKLVKILFKSEGCQFVSLYWQKFRLLDHEPLYLVMLVPWNFVFGRGIYKSIPTTSLMIIHLIQKFYMVEIVNSYIKLVSSNSTSHYLPVKCSRMHVRVVILTADNTFLFVGFLASWMCIEQKRTCTSCRMIIYQNQQIKEKPAQPHFWLKVLGKFGTCSN